MNSSPLLVSHGGRAHWRFADGTLLVAVSGGDGVPSMDDLRDERARLLDEIDDILGTAKEASRSILEDDERERHDAADARVTEIDKILDADAIARSDGERFESAGARRARYASVGVNTAAPAAHASRSLDELLWATAPDVAASGGNARNAVDRVIVRSAPGDEGTPAPRITELAPEHRDSVRNFQGTVARMALFGMLLDKDADSSRKGFEVARSHRLFADEWNNVLRAMDVDTSAEGIDWVPTGIGASLHEKVRASGKVAPLFQRIPIPTNPWKWPIEGGDATIYRVAEPTSDTASKPTASTPGTVAATFDAEIFGGRVLISKSLEADSAVAILPYVERKLVQAFVDGEEKAILDGDTDGTHQDSDVGASTVDARTAWDGLRKKALAQTLATATTVSVANLGLVRKAMTKWGVNPADLAFIIGVSNLHSLIADTNLLTVDKMGPQATILNGQIGSVSGVPVIVSEHVREDLNATGVYDGITLTKTYMLCVNRNEWAMGQRMALDVETDDTIYKETYQRVAIAFQREDFQSIASAATNEDTAMAYNVTP